MEEVWEVKSWERMCEARKPLAPVRRTFWIMVAGRIIDGGKGDGGGGVLE